MHENSSKCTTTVTPGRQKNSEFITSNLSKDASRRQKNFMHGLQNARNILTSLERSLSKSHKYEDTLLRCKASHKHEHGPNEWWESDSFGDKSKNSHTEFPETVQISRSQVDLAESWSTMSIVCLQYQYEELTKRYSSLLQAYDERSKTVSCRDAVIAQLRARARRSHARLVCAHKTLITIGEMYLDLRAKRLVEKSRYKAKMACMERCVYDVVTASERARTELDSLLARSLLLERDADSAMLLAEIRKSNFLFLENLRLKAELEKLSPGSVKWDVDYLVNTFNQN